MKSINKEIFGLAIPNIISNISIPLLSTVDTVLMGFLSPRHIGAVGIGSMLFNFIYWNFGFLRMGTTGLTAQAYGADQKDQIINTLARSSLLALVIAAIIAIFHKPLGATSAYLLNVSTDQYEMVITYFTIRICAAPATMMIYGFKGWFFGMQNAIYPLIMTVAVNILNIAISAYLVIYLSWDIAGVAWGTVAAQYFGLFLAIGLYYFKYRGLNKYINWNNILQTDKVKEFFVLNRDLFLRTVCLTFAFGFFYSQSSKGGELILAANIILQQFLNWMSYGVDGFAHASESLVGKYTGAKQDAKVREAVKYSFLWGGILALVFAITYFFFGDYIIRLFTTDQLVVNFTSNYIFWVALLPLVAFMSYIWDGIYVGLGASRHMRNSMFIALANYLMTFYILSQHMGAHALWLSLFIFLLVRAAMQHYYYAAKGLQLD